MLLSVYLSAFVMDRRALFRAICNLYLAGKVGKLTGIVGYIRAGRMVVFFKV